MGEAKRRGTKEQRVSEAVMRDEQIRREKEADRQARIDAYNARVAAMGPDERKAHDDRLRAQQAGRVKAASIIGFASAMAAGVPRGI